MPLCFSRSSMSGAGPSIMSTRAGDQGGAAARILGRAHEDDAVDLGNALGVPVGVVLTSSARSRGTSRVSLNGPVPDGLLGELVPVLADLLPLRRARDQEPQS